MKANNENKMISLMLNENEAVVLLEWLHNFNEVDRPDLFQHEAEERILFDLEAELETVVSSTFQNNYLDILLTARQKILMSLE